MRDRTVPDCASLHPGYTGFASFRGRSSRRGEAMNSAELPGEAPDVVAPEMQQALRNAYGLGEPGHVQYITWISGVPLDYVFTFIGFIGLAIYHLSTHDLPGAATARRPGRNRKSRWTSPWQTHHC